MDHAVASAVAPKSFVPLCCDQDPKTKELFKGKLGIRNQSVVPREIS